MYKFICLIFFLFASLIAQNNAKPANLPKNYIKLKNVEALDDSGKFLLGWEVSQSGDEIIFEVEAETLGYVGFGISPSGGMKGF